MKKLIFTNKGKKGFIKHHLIDLSNPENNILGETKNMLKQKKYLGYKDA
jgi:hypothetical protein